jgi:hypothetical protein
MGQSRRTGPGIVLLGDGLKLVRIHGLPPRRLPAS